MPAGSPIGSGQGVLNPNNIRIILEYLKDGDPDYPVIVDAGVGTASDVAFAMELGVDGVLLNTAIAHARDPLTMARAMNAACSAGRLAFLSGRIPHGRIRHNDICSSVDASYFAFASTSASFAFIFLTTSASSGLSARFVISCGSFS
jgi:thiazole synthase ThiGH ThiG subunit